MMILARPKHPLPLFICKRSPDIQSVSQSHANKTQSVRNGGHQKKKGEKSASGTFPFIVENWRPVEEERERKQEEGTEELYHISNGN